MPHLRSSPFVLVAVLLCLAAACRPSAGQPVAPEDPDVGGTEQDGDGWSDAHELRSGLFDLYVDPERARLWLRLPPPTGPDQTLATCLYVTGLATGLGSSSVGLDRGSLGSARLISFRRVADRILMEQHNMNFRARSGDADEAKAARDSFPTSVVWAGAVDEELDDGSVVVDITGLAVRDAQNIAERLQRREQGRFSLDENRSVLDPASVLAFPDNLEFEALLTFGGSEVKGEVSRNTPDPRSLTFVQHHSLIRLPDDRYTPRAWHPASGAMAIRFTDFAVPLDAPLSVRYAARHRIEKADPNATSSPAIKPIVYYVDRGAPEPIRSALVEGASWWNDAFAAAGFENGFRVELLPPGVHPLDVRYNVIQWVHRGTRGWSYGMSIRDPRTGEIIKGQVTLGSQRIRQDILLFEGLAGTGQTGTGAADDPLQLALSRIRQLSAHEVGHTLGLMHNFAASTYGRASVMDYPAPKVDIVDGKLNFAQAYGVGIGAWDKQAIRYLYTPFGPEQSAAGLRQILEENQRNGWIYMPDGDARTRGAAHPLASLWDNGPDPIAQFEHSLAVRALALRGFGARNLGTEAEWRDLEAVLAPVYFHHRYQARAALKSVGGLSYDHGPRKRDGSVRMVAADQQRRALAAVLGVLDPSQLDLPEELLARLAPGGDGERLGSATAPAFDTLGAAATAAEAIVSELLESARMARMVDYHRRDPKMPGLEEALDALVSSAFPSRPPRDARRAEIQRVVQDVVVGELIDGASRAGLPVRVRDRLEARLETLARRELTKGAGTADRAHRRALARRVTRFLERPERAAVADPGPEDPPPGSPIGSADDRLPGGRIVVPDLGACSHGG